MPESDSNTDTDTDSDPATDIGACINDLVDTRLEQRIEEAELAVEQHNEKLDRTLDRLNALADRMEIVVSPDAIFSAGPESTNGAYHDNPLWGLHFETDHPLWLGECRIESENPGQVTPTVYEYDRNNEPENRLTGIADQTVLTATGEGEQRVVLDLQVPPGEYLLTRPIYQERHGADVYSDLPEIAFCNDREISLSRTHEPLSVSGVEGKAAFDAISQHGVTFHGGDNPLFSSNALWYYFYDLTVHVAYGDDGREMSIGADAGTEVTPATGDANAAVMTTTNTNTNADDTDCRKKMDGHIRPRSAPTDNVDAERAGEK